MTWVRAPWRRALQAIALAGATALAGCSGSASGTPIPIGIASQSPSTATTPALSASEAGTGETTTPAVSTQAPPAPTVTGTTPSAPPVTPTSDGTSTAEPPDTGFTPVDPSVQLPIVGLGVNDAGCSSDHPPVMLLHGTFGTIADSFVQIAPALIGNEYCLYGVNYGNRGTGPVADSAAAFAKFVGDILALTGAPKVDVIGFSQGGLVLRTALRLDGIADVVDTAVLLAPPFHGTTYPLAAEAPPELCQGCLDQVAGSPLLQQLDAGGDLDGEVRYAVVSTANDSKATPVSSQVPIGPPDRVVSLLIQDRCPASKATHLSIPSMPGVVNWVIDALATRGRPSPESLNC